MPSKLVCSKCGECDFVTINDLETHIVKQHFKINAFYKCWLAKCIVRFATEVDRLKHVHFKQHDINLETVMQMQDESFVTLRLEIQDCLNESINLSFLRLTESNANIFQASTPTSQAEEMRRILSKKRVHNIQNNPSRKEALEPSLHPGTVPGSSERQSYQSFSYKNLLIHFPDNNDEGEKQTSKDKPMEKLMEKLITTFPASSNHNGSLTPSNTAPAAPSQNPKRSRKQNFVDLCTEDNEGTQRRTSSSPLVIKDEPSTQLQTSSSLVVKDETSLIDELAADIPGPSNYENDLTRSNNESIVKRNEKIQPDTSSRPFIVKDEPAEQLTSSFPVSSNHSDSLIPSKTDFALPPQNPKRSRKQNFSDFDAENNKSTKLQTSPNPSMVKDEPSLIDELASMIPGPSNYDDDLTSLTSETQPMDSDNELRIVVAGDDRRKPKYRKKWTTSKKRKAKNRKNLTTEEKEAMVAASNNGRKPEEIAKVFDCGKETVWRVLRQWEMEGNVKAKLRSKYRKRCTTSEKRKSRIRKNLRTPEKEAIVTARNNGHHLEEIARNFARSTRTVCRVLQQWKSEETHSTDSDDELRIIVTGDEITLPAKGQPRPRKPKTRNLRTPEKEAIVTAMNDGHKSEEIAKMFACETKTVRRVLKQWKSEGSVQTKMHHQLKRGGRKRKATEAMELEIAEKAKKDAYYSGSDAVTDMRKMFGIKISRATGARIISNIPRPKRIDDAVEQFIVKIIKDDPFKSAKTVRSEVFEKFNQSISYRIAYKFLLRYSSRYNSNAEERDLPNPKRSRKQNLYGVDGEHARDLSQANSEQDELKIIPPKLRKEWKLTTTTVRHAVVKASSEGLDYRKIARIFDIDRKTVASIMKKWKTEGTVERYKPKPTRKVNDALEQFVVSIVKEDPFKSADDISSMQAKFVCSKCGQCGFVTINDLEQHIVKQHFSSVNALYKCWFSRCAVEFTTEVDRLKHVRYKQHKAVHLKPLNQLQAVDFVPLRLEINKCLNESIALSFSGCTQSNESNFQGPTSSEALLIQRLNVECVKANDLVSLRLAINKCVNESVALARSTQPSKKLKSALNIEKRLATPACQAPAPKKKTEIESPNLVINIDNLFRSDNGTRLIAKGTEKAQSESSPGPFVVKDEPSLIDELASTIPVSSNHSDKLTGGNNGNTGGNNDNTVGNIVFPLTECTEEKGLGTPACQRSATEKKKKTETSSNVAINIDNLFRSEDVTRSTNAKMSYKLKKSSLKYSVLNDAQNKRIERENSQRSCVEKVGHGLSSVLESAEPALSKNDSIDKSNEKTQAEISSGPSVMKEESSLMDELASTTPVISNHSDKLTVGNIKSIDKNNEWSGPETSSNLPVVKDEPILIDELAETVPISSDHSDYLTFGNTDQRNKRLFQDNARIITRRSNETAEDRNKHLSDQLERRPLQESSAPKSAKPRMEILSEQNNELKNTEHENSALPASSNQNGLLIPLNRESAASSLPPKRSKMETVSVLSDENNKITECGNSSKFLVVKDEPNDELTAPAPALSNYYDSLTSLNNESAPTSQKPKRSRKQNFADLDPEDTKNTQHQITWPTPDHVIKNEPNLITELGADIPGPSNYDDDLTSSINDLAPQETKQRPERKHTTPSVRRAVVMANAEGLPYMKIARIFDISDKTVRSIVRRWKTEGTVEKKPYKQAPRKIDPAIEQFIVKMVKDDPFKSPMAVKSEVFKKFDKAISYRTASKVLKRYNSFKIIFQKDLSQSHSKQT